MAKRRMFNLDVIDTDNFIEMPQTTRLLYYELCMRADDDGFVGSPRKIQKMVGCSDDDFKVLISKNYIIPFDSGIIVITHWKLHNSIQKDRYKETIYLDEKKQLYQEENGMYTKCIQDGNEMETKCIQDGYKMETQVRLVKDSIENIKEDNNVINDITNDNNVKKEKRKSFDNVFVEQKIPKDLKDALIDFIDMRKAIKKPLTSRALELAINKLRSLDNDLENQIKIVNQSVENSWQGFYPLKNKNWQEKNKSVGVKSFNELYEN